MKLEQKKLKQKQAAHRKSQAKLYGNMFERMIKMEEKEFKQVEEGLAILPQDPQVTQVPAPQINPAEVSVQG